MYWNSLLKSSKLDKLRCDDSIVINYNNVHWKYLNISVCFDFIINMHILLNKITYVDKSAIWNEHISEVLFP